MAEQDERGERVTGAWRASGPEDIERQAADWIVRLSDPALSAEERAALRARRDRWLEECPDHRAVYRDIDWAWFLLREAAHAAGTLGRPEAVQAEPAEAGSARTDSTRAGRSGRAGRHRWTLGLAGALTLGLLFVLARLYGGDPLLAVQADHRTAPGETRSLLLADGSRVLLGSNSAIAVATEGPGRHVQLLAGEAAFAVAVAQPDAGAARPFLVTVEGLEARALGARFQVRRGPDSTEVTAIEDLVRVALDGQPEDHAVLLGPGERLSVPRDGTTELLEPVDLERATAWQQGRLVFEARPLAEVAAELSRHRRGRILVADPALARREVTGVFQLGEPERAVERLARDLGASRIELPLVTLLY